MSRAISQENGARGRVYAIDREVADDCAREAELAAALAAARDRRAHAAAAGARLLASARRPGRHRGVLRAHLVRRRPRALWAREAPYRRSGPAPAGMFLPQRARAGVGGRRGVALAARDAERDQPGAQEDHAADGAELADHPALQIHPFLHTT